MATRSLNVEALPTLEPLELERSEELALGACGASAPGLVELWLSTR